MTTNTVKDCLECLYLATHEQCDNCLGTYEETKAREDQGHKGYDVYLYKNFTPGDGIARIQQFEREGKHSIVIGGQGEAEVNVNDSPEETLTNLCHVAECCGYVVSKGCWYPDYKEIIVLNHAHYKLVYYQDKLDSIKQVIERSVWSING